MDMMVNTVSPEAAVMPSAEAGTGTQASADGAFGQILNAQMGQQSSEVSSDGAAVQADDTSKPADDQETPDADINAAVAVILAQFMQTNIPDTSSVADDQATTAIPQVAEGQQSNSARMTIPIATDGGPYTAQQAVQATATASTTGQQAAQDVTIPLEPGDPAAVIPAVAEPMVDGADVPLEQAVPEAMTTQTRTQTSADTTQPMADPVADAPVLDPVVRTAIRQALAEETSSRVPQEQASSGQSAANPAAQGQAAANTQEAQFASVTASPAGQVSTETQTNSGDNSKIRLEGLAETAAPAAAGKINGASKNTGNTNTGDNPGSSFAGQGQVQMNSTNTAQAAGTQTTTEAYSDVHQRVIDQVVREVKLRRFDQGGEIVMRLDPPELGTMRVSITQNAGIMTGHISASSDQVKGLLQAHLSTLVDALSEAGVKMDSVSVSTGMPSGTFNQDGAQGSSQNSSNSSRRRFAASGAPASVGALSGTAGAYAANNNVGYSWLA